MNIEKKEIRGFVCISKAKDGFMYRNKTMGLTVIQSIAKEKDNNYWLHTSFSRRSRIPEYKDIQFIKNVFIGKEKKSIMVFPAEKEHVNIHNYRLHLWTCLETDPLPDFTGGTGSI